MLTNIKRVHFFYLPEKVTNITFSSVFWISGKKQWKRCIMLKNTWSNISHLVGLIGRSVGTMSGYKTKLSLSEIKVARVKI